MRSLLSSKYPKEPNEEPRQKIIVTDLDVPFWSMVRLMVKLAIAAIPAAIILVFLVRFVVSVLNQIP